ncbi:GrpB family protein [Bifidobacterium aquikefiricola]|uniref:GrpB family protein n=2 Tax=Bifidobacterium TaxID=1678 RepID=A0AB39U766_9BIFI
MTVEELWQLFPIQLSEHDPQWSAWYEDESSSLVRILGGNVARIDHIGSTYVSGLVAKPIVDILLQVRPTADIADVRGVLEGDGWLLMAECPERGELDLNKGYTPEGFAAKVFHLHVRREGDWDELRFRDYLVGHSDAAAQYGELKRRLLVKYEHNRDAYTQAKTGFIRSCVDKARKT